MCSYMGFNNLGSRKREGFQAITSRRVSGNSIPGQYYQCLRLSKLHLV